MYPYYLFNDLRRNTFAGIEQLLVKKTPGGTLSQKEGNLTLKRRNSRGNNG
jgi:hypothetical protein